MSKNWYAVFTRQACEEKVAAQLAKRQIAYYLPYNYVVKGQADQHKLSYVPLFPSCVFVQITEADLMCVKRIEGVISFLYWLNRPAVIKDEEMEMMQRFLFEHKQVSVTKITVGTRVELGISRELLVTDGKELIKRGAMKLVLPSLGFELSTAEEHIIVEDSEDKAAHPPFYTNTIESLN